MCCPCLQVYYYYITEMLPLCNRLINYTGELREHDPTLVSFPDPGRQVEEHSNLARTNAYIFVKRQQLIRSIRSLLENQPTRLLTYLQSADAS
jgi:hypothetical protein